MREFTIWKVLQEQTKVILARQEAGVGDSFGEWLNRQITDLKRERDEAKKETEHYIEWANCAEGHAKQVTAAESTIAELREAVQVWRVALLNAWANDHRAVMTALLEMGPTLANSKEKP